MKFSSTTTVFGSVLLLAVSLISGLLARGRAEHPLPWRQAWSLRLATQAFDEGFEVVDRAGVEALLAAGTHLLLDARSVEDFDRGHLPGALSLPETEFDEKFPDIAPILLPEGPILVYCSSPACDAALQVAKRLRDAGYPLVTYYPEGYEGWTKEQP
jgi:rhodanese-related sulfurtransferase